LTSLFEAKGKYNNSLIIAISKHQNLRDAFLAFSDSEAQYLIEKSRIHDKKSHMEALRMFRDLCKEKLQSESDTRQGNSSLCSKKSP